LTASAILKPAFTVKAAAMSMTSTKTNKNMAVSYSWKYDRDVAFRRNLQITPKQPEGKSGNGNKNQRNNCNN
jgi:hypothetical protein